MAILKHELKGFLNDISNNLNDYNKSGVVNNYIQTI